MAKPAVKPKMISTGKPKSHLLPGVKNTPPHPKATAKVRVGPSKKGVKPVTKTFTGGSMKKPLGPPKPLSTKKQPAHRAAAPPVAPAAPKPPSVTPFLKPEQQTALNQYDYTYGQNVAAQGRRVGDATYNTNNQLQQAQRGHDVSTRNANDVMAARGLGFSSIRDAELNDLDASLTVRQDTLNTNLRRLMIDSQATLDRLGHSYAGTHSLYDIYAMQNAQAQIPPDVPPAPAAPAPPGAPKPPSAPKPPQKPDFVQNAAKSGVPWAQKLLQSPWAGVGPNTAAGWQAAGYGKPPRRPIEATGKPQQMGGNPLAHGYTGAKY